MHLEVLQGAPRGAPRAPQIEWEVLSQVLESADQAIGCRWRLFSL